MKAKLFLDSDRAIGYMYDDVNLLFGVTPKILDSEGNDDLKLETDLEARPDCYKMLTDSPNHSQHIDIYGKSMTLSYDMGAEFEIDAVSIYGFVSVFGLDFTLEEFEIYFSSSEDELYSPQNKVLHHNNKGNFATGNGERVRHGADFIIEVEDCVARYFGLKIISANPTDSIVRLSALGVFSKKVTEEKRLLAKTVGETKLKGILPEINKGKLEGGDLSALTDTIAGDTQKKAIISAENEIELIIDADLQSPISSVSIFGKEEERDAEIFASDDKKSLFLNKIDAEIMPIEAPNNVQGIAFKTDISRKYIGIRLKKQKAELYEIGVHAKNSLIKADMNDCICNNFYGVGVNCVPVALMEGSRALGYNEAFWEIERRRIINLRPTVVRLWFQLDWFIESGENYERGIYNFDSPKMQCVYKYLDAFLEAGSEIEFNYGWKTSRSAQSWFSFYSADKPEGSAPVDLISFAHSCADILKELWNRGYDNIKYLSFFNEPQNGDDFRGPFRDMEDRAHYYRVMLDFIDWQLKKDGIREKIEIWGPENGWMKQEIAFTDLVEGEEGSPIDVLTTHRYRISYEEASSLYPKLLKSGKGKKPYLLGEVGNSEFMTNWETNPFTTVIGAVDFGMCGALHWIMSDVFYADPLEFIDPHAEDFWALCCGETCRKVYGTFYFQSMLCRYIPAHSKAFKLKIDDESLRACLFVTSDGEITFILTAKDKIGERGFTLDFGKEINKTFYKHEVSLEKHYHYFKEKDDVNAIIPQSVKEIYAASSLSDELSENYSCMVYTTIKPYTQVFIENGYFEIEAGESIQLKADVIDGEKKEFLWNIEANVGETGSVDKNGFYQSSKFANSGDTIAIKAALKDEKSYAIAVIKIK